MTVCIASLCERGKAAIMVADRFVGNASWELAVSGPDSKISPLGDSILAAFAGDSPSRDFIQRLTSPVNGKSDISEAARHVNASVSMYRLKKQKQAAYSRGIKPKDFFRFINKKSNQSIRDEIDKKIPGTELLLIGTDSSGAHVFKIDWEGVESDCDNPGFACIGIGANLAKTAFTKTQK